MGLAVHKPRQAEDNFAVIYYPPLPRAVIEIVTLIIRTELLITAKPVEFV